MKQHSLCSSQSAEKNIDIRSGIAMYVEVTCIVFMGVSTSIADIPYIGVK